MTVGPAQHDLLFGKDKGQTGAAQEFISLAKGLFDLSETRWEDPVWDVTIWCRNRNKTVRWRFLTDEGVLFSTRFDDVVKAALVYQVRVNAKSPSTMVNWLQSIRSLYEVLCQESDKFASSFSWDQLTLRHWQRTEDMIVRKTSQVTRHSRAVALQAFATLLEARNIVGCTRYSHRQSRLRNTSVRHIEDREAAMEKLPPMQALQALADASRDPKDDWDRVLFAIVKLLVALGFRMGEVLTLPADCWRVNGEGRHYLTYWPEKGGPLSPKWVPSTVVELVQGAVETLQTLTQEERQRARVLETDPTHVPLPGDYSLGELLGTADLSQALQMTRSGVVKYLKRLNISPSRMHGGKNGKGWLWKVDELERALVKALPEHRYELVTSSGGKQRLSEHLCLMRKRPRRGKPSLLTVSPIPASAVANFVTSYYGHNSKSVFERYELLDENGKPWSVSPHQFRHWLNTVAHKGGLPDFELARWMGRQDIRQNLSYQHLNQEERIERVKEAVRNKEMVGPMSEVYHRSPADDRESFLDAQVEAAHVTPYGTCTHNFATKPCPYNVQCLTGCGSFLRTKGDQREVTYIRQIKRRAEHNIKAAEKAAVDGMPEAANWINHERRLLEGGNRALAIEDDSKIEIEERAPVFPDAPDFGDIEDNKRC